MVGSKKKKLTEKDLKDMEEYLDKLLDENQVLGERCKDFLDNLRGHLLKEINHSDLPRELLIYIIQREFLNIAKSLLQDKALEQVLIISHEAIADTIKDNLYPQITQKISLH